MIQTEEMNAVVSQTGERDSGGKRKKVTGDLMPGSCPVTAGNPDEEAVGVLSLLVIQARKVAAKTGNCPESSKPSHSLESTHSRVGKRPANATWVQRQDPTKAGSYPAQPALPRPPVPSTTGSGWICS